VANFSESQPTLLVSSLQIASQNHLNYHSSAETPGAMLGIRRQNLILVVVVLLAALSLYFFICPYLELMGARRLCIALYAVLLLFYVYARANRPAVRRARRPPPSV
jgi:Ca2+/Na+ antiporter